MKAHTAQEETKNEQVNIMLSTAVVNERREVRRQAQSGEWHAATHGAHPTP